MKKNILLLFLSFTLCFLGKINAQCPDVDIVLSSQSEVDNFPINYPNCIEIDVNVIISGNDITNLDSLNTIQQISGLWIKDNPNLSNLSGLNNLQEVGCIEGFKIENNDALTNLEGLNMLSTIRCGLSILDNDGLSSLAGLVTLDTIYGCGCFGNGAKGTLSIESNDNLSTIDGLDELEYVYEIAIIDTEVLVDLDVFQNIDTLGILIIENNDPLTNLDGLPFLDSLGTLIIQNNNSLQSLNGIQKIERLFELSIINNDSLISLVVVDEIPIDSSAGKVIISDNELLESIEGLDVLETVGSLEISNNPSLTSLEGLESLERARLLGCCGPGCGDSPCFGSGNLSIINNDKLTNLNGLENLNTVNAYLDIKGNDSLITLLGLNSLLNIGQNNFGSRGIRLENNSLLSNCATQIICGLLPDIISVDDNDSGCNSIAEIETACMPNSIENMTSESIEIFPNPTFNFLQIKGINLINLEYEIFDIAGRLVQIMPLPQNNKINTERLSQGVYIINLKLEDSYIFTKKFIKE